MPFKSLAKVRGLGWTWTMYLPLLLLALVLAIPGQVHAVEYDWAGFATIGIAHLDDDSINDTDNNFVPHNLVDEGTQANVDSRIGLQGGAIFTDRFSATAQVLLADDQQNDAVELEWAYLSYDFTKATILRVGRLRRPYFYNSDFLPVGYVYPWVRPPVEVYSREVTFSDNIDAISLLHRGAMGDWVYEAEIYHGNSSDEVTIGRVEDVEFDTTHGTGIVVNFEKDWLGLRFGYHRTPDLDAGASPEFQSLLDGLSAIGPLSGGAFDFSDLVGELETRNKEAEFYNIAVNIDYEDWLLGLELVHVPIEGFAPDEDSWYLTGGRRFGPWTAHITYAEREKEFDEVFSAPVSEAAATLGTGPLPPALDAIRTGLVSLTGAVDMTQEGFVMDYNSVTLGLRYDFDQPISIKAELQRVSDDRNNLTNNLASVVVDFLF